VHSTQTLTLDPFLAPPDAAAPRPSSARAAEILRTSYTYNVASLAFLAMAALDAFEPTVVVTGAWWLVLLLVWLMPWPDRTFDTRASARPSRAALHQIATLAVFSWLLFRANTAVLEAVSTWKLFDPYDAVYRFTYLLQDTVVGLVAIALLARPLLRTFHRNAKAAAFLIATPWMIIACTGTAFDLTQWIAAPALTYLSLFEAVFPVLLLMLACERGVRALGTQPARRRLTGFAPESFVRGQAGGRLTALTFLLAVALVVAAIGVELELPDALLAVIPILGSTWELVMVAVTLLLTVTTIAFIRALRAKSLRIGPLQLYGSGTDQVIASLLLGPVWLLAVLHAAPVIGAGAIDTLQRMPAPVWNIRYDADARVIHLAGGYGEGVAQHFADYLAAHPEATAVELSGPGGWLDEGLRIAELIEERGVATIVRERCASACTFAFAGGKERIVVGHGRLGFHAGRHPSVLLEWLKNTDLEDAFLQERGVNHDFIARVNAVSNDDIWYPTHDELKSAGVITAIR
jgi:hypothetical protein